MNSKERYEQALAMKPYYERGESLTAVAKRFGTHDMTVRRRMTMLGILRAEKIGRPHKETANEPD